jgi:hypothetical protein
MQQKKIFFFYSFTYKLKHKIIFANYLQNKMSLNNF